jgi:hypothetical protein
VASFWWGEVDESSFYISPDELNADSISDINRKRDGDNNFKPKSREKFKKVGISLPEGNK